MLAVLLVRLKHTTGQSRAQLAKLLVFIPRTVLNWYQDMVRWKWMFADKRRVGRPAIADELRQLVIRLANENHLWGWVAQQARQLCWNLDSRARSMRFLIHDNDTKFTAGFDAVFQSAGAEVIHTPVRAPNANAIARYFVRTVCQECLDQLVIVSDRQLRRVLTASINFYNTRRPPQAGCREKAYRASESTVSGIFSKRVSQ